MLRCRLITAVVLLATFTAASAKAAVVNLLANGQFTDATPGFTSQYTDNQASTRKEGSYAVLADPHLADHLWGRTHAPLGGDLLSVNGATNRNRYFWSETVGVQPNSTYTFTLWAASNTGKNTASLELMIDGKPAGAPLSLGKLAGDRVGKWVEYVVTWNSGADTSADLQLLDRNTRGTGNDFSIADLSFTGLAPMDQAQDPPPISGPGTSPGPVPGVPEPATWTLLILAAGMVGVALRRRPPSPEPAWP